MYNYNTTLYSQQAPVLLDKGLFQSFSFPLFKEIQCWTTLQTIQMEGWLCVLRMQILHHPLRMPSFEKPALAFQCLMEETRWIITLIDREAL